MSFNPLPYLVMPGVAVVWQVVMIARRIPGLWMSSSQFNSTEDWTPVPQDGQTPAGLGEILTEWHVGVITSHLEAGEALKGYARGFFWPPRPRDWGNQYGLQQHPLLIAVTSHRMLLFELGPRTVHRSCFIGYDAIQFLRPPKQRLLGTSGPMRFGLHTGREYQVGFLGPLFSDEGMRQEQRLASYLRGLASRFQSSPAAEAA